MIDKAQIAVWGGWCLGAIGTVHSVFNRIKLKSLEVKTDGLLQYRSRADRAEGRLEEQGDVRTRAKEKKEHEKQ
jgi:hypothetical protein